MFNRWIASFLHTLCVDALHCGSIANFAGLRPDLPAKWLILIVSVDSGSVYWGSNSASEPDSAGILLEDSRIAGGRTL